LRPAQPLPTRNPVEPLLLAAIINSVFVFSESRGAQLAANQIQRDLKGFPTESVVVWGGAFPFVAAFPVFGQSASVLSFRLYPLGVFTHAPFSVSYDEEGAGRGFIDRLSSESGVPIVATAQSFTLLKIYCEERLGGDLAELALRNFGSTEVSWRRCESKPLK